MQLPASITFRHIPPFEAIEAKIRKDAAKLECFYDRIMSCPVVAESPHRHHYKDRLDRVRIDLTAPNGELVVKRDPPEHQTHENISVVIRDAFDAAKRKLQDYARLQRHKTKTHEVPPHGWIATLFPDEGYGFIETSDGREVYFHQNSVLNGAFSQLQVGDEVRFTKEEGNKGLQTITVRLIGKHHLLG
ncbi:MAG: HPF/RaiA family ribosome-associated protein [Hydrococcus sp. C42_A2020_068]|nr:HPF/RaiA family ribosome-associated protein [Hydrococcus sp. C42_A2020_068]